MTGPISNSHDTARPGAATLPALPASGDWDVYANSELRALEDVDSGTPPAIAIAHGLSAITYALLSLRETCDNGSVLIGNALADVNANVAETASYVCDVANAIDDARWLSRVRRQLVGPLAQLLALPGLLYRKARRLYRENAQS
jgi:hypothetical protein